jgi:hypothetical protein
MQIKFSDPSEISSAESAHTSFSAVGSENCELQE